MKIEQVAVSPCSNPEMGLDDVLSAYASLGYKHFEVFTSWTNSAFDYHTCPQAYLKIGQQFSMVFTSFHLPPITAGGLTDSLQEAITAAVVGLLMTGTTPTGFHQGVINSRNFLRYGP